MTIAASNVNHSPSRQRLVRNANGVSHTDAGDSHQRMVPLGRMGPPVDENDKLVTISHHSQPCALTELCISIWIVRSDLERDGFVPQKGKYPHADHAYVCTRYDKFNVNRK